MKIFSLKKRIALITGGGGLLGVEHACAIHQAGGIPVLADIDLKACKKAARRIGRMTLAIQMDVSKPESIRKAKEEILHRFGRLDILINNAARNPKVKRFGLVTTDKNEFSNLENLNLDEWNLDLEVGLTGSMLCSQIFGSHMAEHGNGVILNIASDLALIGPDQRIYRKTGLSESRQPKKPVSYSVVKSGLLGLTRYLATYWADKNVRVNALCPGGVENGQPPEFLTKLSNLIPMRRMARIDEYQGAVIFLCSDASSYMTGSIVVMDGGRTCW